MSVHGTKIILLSEEGASRFSMYLIMGTYPRDVLGVAYPKAVRAVERRIQYMESHGIYIFQIKPHDLLRRARTYAMHDTGISSSGGGALGHTIIGESSQQAASSSSKPNPRTFSGRTHDC